MELQEFREIGHQLVDLLADYLANVEERPVFPSTEPGEINALFAEEMPRSGEPLRAVIQELEEKLLPNVTQVNHPGYFGYITPSPAPVGILADLLASALNQNVALYSIGPAAVAIERRTVKWLTELVGFDEGSGGNLTSGGTLANFVGLKLARDRVSGDRAQREGVRERWAAYTSEERHVSVDKAVDAVGIGRDQLRVIPTDDDFRIRLDRLEQAIEEDLRAGIRPMCIIGMGGSTNTGAVDPLSELRVLADRYGVWLHVDAAYGGGMLLSHRHGSVLRHLALADSVTLDPHKWFFAPLDVGAVLVRDERQLTRSFGMRPEYLTERSEAANERYDYFVHGFEQSRRFRSLKVWMSLKRYGADRIGEWVDANVAHARRLYELATAHPDFHVAVEPMMSAICLRYAPDGWDEAELGPLHGRVAQRVEESGRFWISTTVLKGRTYFRVNPVNFRTRTRDIDGLFMLLVDACGEERERRAAR